MRQFIKFTEELSGFLMFLRLIYFMIKYVEVKINFLIHHRSNYIYTRMTNFQYYIFLKEKFNIKDREVVVWKSMSLGAMIINFFSLINVPASIHFLHISMISCSYLWSGYLSSCWVFYSTFEIVMAYTY